MLLSCEAGWSVQDCAVVVAEVTDMNVCVQVPATSGFRVPVMSWQARRRSSRTHTSSSAPYKSRAGWTGADSQAVQTCLLVVHFEGNVVVLNELAGS